MKDLDVTVGFSTTNKIGSRIIRWVTQAPCSHAWVSFMDDTLGMRLVMQAEWWGYEVRPWPRWVRENRLVAEFEPVGSEFREDLSESVVGMAQSLGSRYDFESAFWVGLKRWFLAWSGSGYTLRPSRTPKQLMCAESVVRILASTGAGLCRGVDPESMSPGELLELVQTYPVLRARRV